MCQATAGKVISVSGKKAKVLIDGKQNTINTEFVKVKKGDYVICAANIAVEKISKEEAKKIAGN